MKYYTINEAAKYLSLDAHYIRKLVREDKLPSKQVKVGSTKVWRHEIAQSDLDARKTIKKSQRKDGRTKYTIYLNASEKIVHDKIYKEAKLVNLIKRANPPKKS